ncbi:MAG TPA: SpoIIE family protein phosphatase [Actinocrinis sp.]|nr:SpoIIE family protein phosphatase [Actinocrinis sp.]
MEPRPEHDESAAARPGPPRYFAPGGPGGPDPAAEVYSPTRIAAAAAAIVEAATTGNAGGRTWCAETAAQRATAIIRAAFTDGTGESAVVLVRIFQTCVWESLTVQLRSFVLARLGEAPGVEPAAVPAVDPAQGAHEGAGAPEGADTGPDVLQGVGAGAAPQSLVNRRSGRYSPGPDTATQDVVGPGIPLGPPGLIPPVTRSAADPNQATVSRVTGPRHDDEPYPGTQGTVSRHGTAAPMFAPTQPTLPPPPQQSQPPVIQGPATQRAGLANTPCLALLATDGERPSWTDRRASLNHQALPLNGPEVLERVPLVLTVLGDLVGATGLPREQDGRTRLAVHPVSPAAGSPLVPAQWLTAQHGVTAALGLGGLLPSGEAFTLVLFSRAPLPADASIAFRPLVQSLHTLLGPLSSAPLFEPAGPVGRVLPHEGEHRAADRTTDRLSDRPGDTGERTAQRLFTAQDRDSSPPPRSDGRGEGGWQVKPRPSVEAALRDHRARLAQEARIIETLYSVGQTLAKQLDLSKLVRTAIEAATSVVGARFGAFFYSVRETDGQSQVKYALAGLPPDSFDQFPLPRAAGLLSSGALISSTIRLADVAEEMLRGAGSAYPPLALPGRPGPLQGDPGQPGLFPDGAGLASPDPSSGSVYEQSRYAQPGSGRTGYERSGNFQPGAGDPGSAQSGFADPGYGVPNPAQSYTMPRNLSASASAGTYPPGNQQSVPPGHPPVRSYLAVPVTAASGEILGSFYFGHPDIGVFTERDEQLAKGVAAQAASAMDNARLYRRERATAITLQHSLLPTTPEQMGDLEVASSYMPGEQGSRVGGDWFDVIALSSDRVALVIGDVMGRGIEAAAVMGQLRAAIQAYAVMDLPPAQILDQLNRLVCQLPDDQIATCVYAVFDPAESTVRWSNAGHLPPLLTTPDGKVTLLEANLGMPLGVDRAVFSEAIRPMPAGSRLLLYTDGLVECRDQSLADRLGELRDVMADLSAPGVMVGAQESCKHLISTLITGEEHDDVALLLITVQPGSARSAQLDLPPTLEAARTARGFIRSTLASWEAEDFTDSVISVASELVNNAAEHAGTPLALTLRQRDQSMLIEVADGDGRLVRPTAAGEDDERHRGLVIVSTMAKRWGVRPTESGKIVWAELTVL